MLPPPPPALAIVGDFATTVRDGSPPESKLSADKERIVSWVARFPPTTPAPTPTLL